MTTATETATSDDKFIEIVIWFQRRTGIRIPINWRGEKTYVIRESNSTYYTKCSEWTIHFVSEKWKKLRFAFRFVWIVISSDNSLMCYFCCWFNGSAICSLITDHICRHITLIGRPPITMGDTWKMKRRQWKQKWSIKWN